MFLLLLIAAFFDAILSRSVPQNPNFPSNDDVDMRYFLTEKKPGVYVLEDLLEGEINTRTSAEDVTYFFFSPENPHQGIHIKSTNIEDLRKTRFSRLRTTAFLIHGWMGHNQSSSNSELTKAILYRNKVNIFVVDWSRVASRHYGSAAMSVVPVGMLIGDFIKSLVKKYGISLSDVTLIGYSLGAHLAGNIGAALNGEVDQIVGLDPAGPLFYVYYADFRLNPDHGRYVQIIHTNNGVFGYKFPSGHSDYYPNGGWSQPGCRWYHYWLCAHYRSYEFYAESVMGRSRFTATQCSSHDDYKKGDCSGNHISFLGGYPVDKRANGTYYLETNSASPYAKGLLYPNINPRDKHLHTSTSKL